MTDRISRFAAAGKGGVPAHEHEPEQISGTWPFVRILNALITGDLTIEGFFRTAESGQRIEIRPLSGPTGLVPSLVFWTGKVPGFTGSEGFIEVRDNTGTWSLLVAGPHDTTIPAATLDLRSDGRMVLFAPELGVEVDGPLFLRRVADSLTIGAQFTLQGADTFPDWVIDTADDHFRIRDSSVVYLGIDAGAGIEVHDEPAYLFKEQVRYTASDTFTKADYPGLRAVRVKCQGGGGAGGGAATTGAGQSSGGSGGNAGGYAESFILAADLDTTEAVTVGAGGSGASGANGGDGNDSVFDTISGEVRGLGGPGGIVSAASGTLSVGNQSQPVGGTGDLVVYGEPGDGYLRINVNSGRGSKGGKAFLGGGVGTNSGANANGDDANLFGAGGGGAHNEVSQGTARTGGDGAAGIVIVDVYV